MFTPFLDIQTCIVVLFVIMSNINVPDWWGISPHIFCRDNRWILQYIRFGYYECDYDSTSEFHSMTDKESDFDGFTTRTVTKPTTEHINETKTTDRHTYVEDNLYAFYEADVNPVDVTWTIDDNNAALGFISDWYLDRPKFEDGFIEVKRDLWSIETIVDCSTFIEYPGYPYDNNEIDVPIELFYDGPKRSILGSPFTHMVERDWICDLNIINSNSQAFGLDLQLRRLVGTFGWFWLAGRITWEGQQLYVLFCNEKHKHGGYKTYVSASAYDKTSESRGFNSLFPVVDVTN